MYVIAIPDVELDCQIQAFKLSKPVFGPESIKFGFAQYKSWRLTFETCDVSALHHQRAMQLSRPRLAEMSSWPIS